MNALFLKLTAVCSIAARARAQYSSQNLQCSSLSRQSLLPQFHRIHASVLTTTGLQTLLWSLGVWYYRRTANETSKVIQIIVENQCPFGVWSGGHAVFAGSSSTNKGITVDLGVINGTTYEPENIAISCALDNIPNEVAPAAYDGYLAIEGALISTLSCAADQGRDWRKQRRGTQRDAAVTPAHEAHGNQRRRPQPPRTGEARRRRK
ncbi:hypothetical protein CIB48_g7057 [Xylaria polymorpha]|nr:hypothetical protein CIB48_g7057 [Xylaria polymorpha]